MLHPDDLENKVVGLENEIEEILRGEYDPWFRIHANQAMQEKIHNLLEKIIVDTQARYESYNTTIVPELIKRGEFKGF